MIEGEWKTYPVDNIDWQNVTKKSGVYILFDKDYQPLYIGASLLLKDRLRCQLLQNTSSATARGFRHEIAFVRLAHGEWLDIHNNGRDLRTIERILIMALAPKYNKQENTVNRPYPRHGGRGLKATS